jgi:DNA-binding transcriptional LysR family regulator
MKNWDDLRFCHALYQHGTMSDAAKVLNTNVATVSRRLHRLSEEVGETLFIKEGNRWVATEAGIEFARIADRMQAEILGTSAGKAGNEPEVQIRLSCASQFLHCGIAANLSGFLARHPLVSFRFDTRKRSLALNECDVRLGFEEPTEGRIVRRLFTSLDLLIACNHGAADRLEGWVNILYDGREVAQSGALHDHFDAPPKVEIEGLSLAQQILGSNPFAALFPRCVVDESASLVATPGFSAPDALPIWLSYHETRRRDTAVRLAVELLEIAMQPDGLAA